MEAQRTFGARSPCRRTRSSTVLGKAKRGRWRRAKAFTLIELLVVIAIIAMLVGILVPAVSKAQEFARRVKCSANLDGVSTALSLYHSEYEFYPLVPLNGGDWRVPIGHGRGIDPARGGSQGRNSTSCLYLLVKEEFTSEEMFVCPATREKSRREGDEWWDFVDGTAISYSLTNPYGEKHYFDDGAGPRELMADSSPYFDPATGVRNQVEVVDWSDASPAEVRRGNSPNHKGEGQNVMVAGGAVGWRKRADIGLDNDNIYSRAQESDGTDAHGEIPDPLSGPAAGQGPAGRDDAYMVP